MSFTTPKSQTNMLPGLQSLLSAAWQPLPQQPRNGRSFAGPVSPSLPPVCCCEFHAKPPLLRGEEHPQQELGMQSRAWLCPSICDLTTGCGVTATRLTSPGPHTGLLWPQFPLAEALPVCLSSLLYVHKNRAKSHRAGLGRAVGRGYINRPWVHKSAVGMLYLGSPGITWAGALALGCNFHDRPDIGSSWS